MGRQSANTKLSSNVSVRRVRVRGGNFKFRALRLDSGNFSWGSEAVTRKTRVLDVVYNSSNNELVGKAASFAASAQRTTPGVRDGISASSRRSSLPRSHADGTRLHTALEDTGAWSRLAWASCMSIAPPGP
jgi:Ribosomal protein S8e